jgi:triacylglycerol esterase/lipase EstA (alpha/beta hydrolase family)
MVSWIASCLILVVGFYNIYLSFLHTKNIKNNFKWAFQILIHFFFQRSKSQLKSELFVHAFDFLIFQLKKPAQKQEQTCP